LSFIFPPRIEASGYPQENPEEYCKKWWSVIRTAYVTNPADAAKVFSGLCEFPNEWPANQLKHLSENILASIKKLDLGEEQLAPCGMPVLTIHGTEDRAVPYGAAREWVFNLPNARLITIDKGGHLPWIESPGIVFPAIRTFLHGEWPAQAEEINVADFK
jgi:pimeloyl-ACP methyl ester carboxylesterase